MTCQDFCIVGHLVEHQVTFVRADEGKRCDLSRSERGDLEHLFTNRSIYLRTFSTAASTMPSALAVVGAPSPSPVKVLPGKRGPLYRPGCTGKATQKIEHQPTASLTLPHTATAEFTTTVTGPGSTAGAQAGPRINIDLVP